MTFGHLQELTLFNNGLRDKSAGDLLRGVSSLRALRKLNFSKNELGASAAEEIVKILLWPYPYNLEDLILEDVRSSDYTVAIVFQKLKSCKKLKKLHTKSINLSN